MGRIGDGDIHAAFVEFRAKESDKVLLLAVLRHNAHGPSAFQRNASIANRSGLKTPAVNARTFSSVLLILTP